jgi:hypothetical protein
MSHHIDHLIKSLEGLSPELRRELARRLESDVLAEVSAADTAKAEKVRVAKIHAMRAEGNNPTFNYCQGVLRRLGVTIEDVEDVAAFDRLFASSALSSRVNADERLATKHGLYKLGLLAA